MISLLLLWISRVCLLGMPHLISIICPRERYGERKHFSLHSWFQAWIIQFSLFSMH
jgi:hypothetical protein